MNVLLAALAIEMLAVIALLVHIANRFSKLNFCKHGQVLGRTCWSCRYWVAEFEPEERPAKLGQNVAKG